MTDQVTALERVRAALKSERDRNRMTIVALDELERLVSQLELACIRQVAEACDAGLEHAARMVAELGTGRGSEILTDAIRSCKRFPTVKPALERSKV